MPKSTSQTRWRFVKIEQLAANMKNALAMGPFGSRITKNNFVETGVPVIRGINLSNGRFYHQDFVFLTEEKANELAASNAFPDDLVFTHRGTLGQVGIIPKGYYPRYVVSQSQMKLTCDQTKVLPMFLYYYFRSEVGLHELLSHTGGSGVPAISSPLTTLRNATIYLPALSTQHKIAAILSAYDDLIANNTRRIAILEEMAQSLYREWFVHFRFPGHEKKRLVESELGLIPEGWEVVRFTDIADVLSGGTPRTTTSEYWNGPIPFFTPRDAPSSFYVTETEKSITQIGLRACNSKLYPRNTVFITARGTVGKVVLSAIDMAMNQSCYALQGRDGIDQFTIFLSISNCIDQLKQNAHGAVFDTIIVDTFRMLQVVKPPLALTNVFKSLVLPIFEIVLNLLNKNANLRQTRDLLLPKLISGEVNVEGLDIHVEGGTYESHSNKFPEIPSGNETVHYSDLSAHV